MTDGTAELPWQLTTPAGTTDYQAWFDTVDNAPVLMCRVGANHLYYDRECIDDLRDMLLATGDWVELGDADEQEEPQPGTVEAWARASDNPTGGWYGLTSGQRGHFAAYVPPVLEHLGIAEVEHNPSGNRMRAVVPSPGFSTTAAQITEPALLDGEEE